MVRAIAYIRVSTDRQATDGTSLVTQRRRVVEYTTLKGYRLVKLFIEEGESAKTDNRPVLKEMLQFCEKERGTLDLLVFPKIDRFARYSEDYHHLKRQLRNLGIRIESIDERFDDSPAGRFLESMLAATAQFDNDVRSERTYNGMREAAMQGRWVWRAPVGYRNIRIDGKANIEPHPQQAPLVIEAFERIARHARVMETMEWLNERGVRISRNGFYAMLRNKAYIGIIDSFGIESRGAVPFTPLVSADLFERAQAALAPSNVPKTYQRDHEEFPLRGTVRCPCGQFLTAGWSRGRKVRYPYYRCRSCSRVNLRRDHVEEQFLAMMGHVRSEYGFTDDLIQEARELFDKEAQGLKVVTDRLNQERERLVHQQKTLVQKVADGVVPDELAREQFEDFGQRLRQIDGRLGQVTADPREPDIETVLSFSQRFLQRVQEHWQTADLRVKKKIQQMLFPTGAVLSVCGKARTAFEGSSTGLDASSFYTPVMFGGPLRQNGESRDSLPERLEFYKRLYRDFGRHEEQESKGPID